MKKCTCKWCGKDFAAQRSSAKFCSDVCKMRSHRYTPSEDIAERGNAAAAAIAAMTRILERSPELVVEVYEQLEAIDKLVSHLKRSRYGEVVAQENIRQMKREMSA